MKLLRVTPETKTKLAWIGKMLFVGMVAILLGSMILEITIHGLANKLEAYLRPFFN